MPSMADSDLFAKLLVEDLEQSLLNQEIERAFRISRALFPQHLLRFVTHHPFPRDS